MISYRKDYIINIWYSKTDHDKKFNYLTKNNKP